MKTITANGKTKIVMNRKEWEAIGKTAGWNDGTEWLDLGPTPSGEDCLQVGKSTDAEQVAEIRIYFDQVVRTVNPDRNLVKFKISANPHEFGTYHNLEVGADSENEAAIEEAVRIENGCPEFWDEEAKRKLVEAFPGRQFNFAGGGD
jgi:hypothetical protein